jgi:hypothetical protein
MGTLALNADERVSSVEFADGYLVVGLKDGRRISVPLEWYPRLAGASADARVDIPPILRGCSRLSAYRFASGF